MTTTTHDHHTTYSTQQIDVGSSTLTTRLGWWSNLWWNTEYDSDNWTITLQVYVVSFFFVTHGILTLNFVRRNFFEVRSPSCLCAVPSKPILSLTSILDSTGVLLCSPHILSTVDINSLACNLHLKKSHLFQIKQFHSLMNQNPVY